MTAELDAQTIMSILLGHTRNTTGLNHTELYDILVKLRNAKRDDD